MDCNNSYNNTTKEKYARKVLGSTLIRNKQNMTGIVLMYKRIFMH